MSLSFLDIQWQFRPIWAVFLNSGTDCGLMDVGLEIRKINPRRFCLIFKRHLTFLSCVFFVLDVCRGEDSIGVATVACPQEPAHTQSGQKGYFQN